MNGLALKVPSSLMGEVKFEDFTEFAMSKYQPTIARCQQVALQKACRSVPTPAQQLELANAKRDKEPRSHHVCDFRTISSLSISFVALINDFLSYIISVSGVSTKLRQYEILEQLQMQDKWVVQLRQRQKGGAKGDIYYVYVSPQGRLRYTKSLDWGVTSLVLPQYLTISQIQVFGT
jgi:hypothetical protein